MNGDLELYLYAVLITGERLASADRAHQLFWPSTLWRGGLCEAVGHDFGGAIVTAAGMFAADEAASAATAAWDMVDIPLMAALVPNVDKKLRLFILVPPGALLNKCNAV